MSIARAGSRKTLNLTDCRGIPVSANSRTTLDRLETATDLMHGFSGDPLPVVDKAIAEDATFVMGHCLRASLLLSALDMSLHAEIRASISAAEKLEASANKRERMHIAALSAWLSENAERAGTIYDEILSMYPLDTLALQMGHAIDYFLGDSRTMLARVQNVLPHWSDAVPGYSYVLGMHAFALEETGEYVAAEAAGLRALELNARDVWAIHALAHVYEAGGRQSAGIAYLTQRARDWAVDNALAIHNWWHVALFHFDLGEIERVLQLYDATIREPGSKVLMDLVDASALLWRLNLLPIDVSSQANELADAWQSVVAEQVNAFASAHAMMAFALTNRDESARRLLAQLAENATRDNQASATLRLVALPVCRALLAFAKSDYLASVTLLKECWSRQPCLGGSITQRDVFSLTAIEAALRGGSTTLARELTTQRILARPRSPYSQRLANRASSGSSTVTE
jgi:tetratricopeptide (TPR) repeat protein